MKEIFEQISKLIKVKSIVTLTLLLLVFIMALKGDILRR